MNETKNIKPLICSEYGSLNFVRDDRGYWMHIKNINAFMLNFLDRPNDFSIAVPFMLSFMHWAPDSLETFIHQSPDGEFIKTKNTFILDMWSGFKGKRIPCRDTEHKVLSHAVIDEDTIRLAVNNRSGRRILLEIDSILPKNKEIVSNSFENNSENLVHHKDKTENQNINKTVNNNEAQFLMLANKFNEAVEVILELSHKVEKLERNASQKSYKQTKNVNSSSFFYIKIFVFILLIPIMVLGFFTLPIDTSSKKTIIIDVLSTI